MHEILADARRAALFDDVCFVLVAEILERRQDRVRRRLTERAHCVRLDVVAELFHLIEILERAVAGRDLVEHFEKASRTDTARRALAAALVDREVEEEARDVDHAGRVVHDDHTAGAHHSADLDQVVIIDRQIEILRRDAAAGRTAGLNGLKLSAVRDAAADVIDDLAERGAHRDLNEAGVDDLAAECEDLGALALLGAHGGEPLCALQNDLRDVRERFNVVDDRGLTEQALVRRERGLVSRLAAVALDGGQKRGLFAANERACAETDFDVEIKAGAEDILAQEAVFTRLADCDLKTLDRDRVLCTDVDVALVRADRVTCDRHCLEDRMRVAFEDGTVHECAGVALVRVADDVLLRDLIPCRKVPLHAGREACAASAAKARILHDLDDLLRRHFGEYLAERGIAVHGDVLFDLFRVDDAAVAKRNTHLRLVEACFLQRRDLDLLLALGLPIDETVDDTALQEVLRNDLRNILELDTAVERALRVHDHDRAQCAKAEAARAYDLDLICKAVQCDLFFQCVCNLDAAGRGTPRTAANQNMRTNHSVFPPLSFHRTDGIFCDGFAVDQMLLDDLGYHFGLDLDVGHTLLIPFEDLNDRLKTAHADAAGLRDGHAIAEILFRNLFHKGVQNGTCACRDAAGRHADDDTDLAGAFPKRDFVFHSVTNLCKFCQCFHVIDPFIS